MLLSHSHSYTFSLQCFKILSLNILSITKVCKKIILLLYSCCRSYQQTMYTFSVIYGVTVWLQALAYYSYIVKLTFLLHFFVLTAKTGEAHSHHDRGLSSRYLHFQGCLLFIHRLLKCGQTLLSHLSSTQDTHPFSRAVSQQPSVALLPLPLHACTPTKPTDTHAEPSSGSPALACT